MLLSVLLLSRLMERINCTLLVAHIFFPVRGRRTTEELPKKAFSLRTLIASRISSEKGEEGGGRQIGCANECTPLRGDT